MLKAKYEEKAKMGALAEKKNCFNSAVSLYYYNIYLRLKYYLNAKQIKVNVANKSSHQIVIKTFIKDYYASHKPLNLDEIKAMNSIESLLYKRKKADYEENFTFDSKNYNNEFKKYYVLVDNILKSKGV
ncbi:hypothetical protein DW663_09270 [Fusobacterium mortiferum]|uniref:HEPN domain-containing protein n=1 Tax=Fusobacterium mortiferum TaxID=850 RepID=A0A414PRB4_FUSMR|nr:hypothetical protein [Fusobacterium mortiferum]MCI6381367.1 hypothetical protein [Fusobacterium mortiferum]RHF71098.1 hypothetical protein DW663_09270 [Fusobacterium mortiferum]